MRCWPFEARRRTKAPARRRGVGAGYATSRQRILKPARPDRETCVPDPGLVRCTHAMSIPFEGSLRYLLSRAVDCRQLTAVEVDPHQTFANRAPVDRRHRRLDLVGHRLAQPLHPNRFAPQRGCLRRISATATSPSVTTWCGQLFGRCGRSPKPRETLRQIAPHPAMHRLTRDTHPPPAPGPSRPPAADQGNHQGVSLGRRSG